MVTIRCPSCGTLNHADDLSYPRCGQCHEDLVHCGDCRHYEAGACAHPQAHLLFTPDLEAAKQCPTFVSRHEKRDARIFAAMPAPLWMVLLVTIIIGALAAIAWFIDPRGRYFVGNPLELKLQIPAQVVTNQPFMIAMRITNLLPERSTRIFVEIGEEYLLDAVPGMPFPPPLRITRGPERLLLEYGPLGSHAQLPLQLPFVQRKRGVAMFVARIYAPENRLFREIRMPISAIGMSSLPSEGKEGVRDERGG